MKKVTFSLLALFVFSLSSFATNYYFSSSGGDDSRSSAEAKSPATPWRSLDKLNSLFSSLQPGDSVLFKRGDTFFGSVKVRKSGTSSAPIVLGAYGTGSKPVITGFTALTNWTSLGGGVYESNTVLPNDAVNVVVLNGAVQEMGRYPNSNAANKGFLYFEAHDGVSSITDNDLPSTINWKGAELVIRAWKSAIDRTPIKEHSGGKLSVDLEYEPHDGFGYFIQNDARTLDREGEWYYSTSKRKLRMFFGAGAPSGYAVKVSTQDTLVFATDINYLVLNGLAFQGSNKNTLLLRYGSNITISDCDLLYSGGDALTVNGTDNVKVLNNTFNHSLSNAIEGALGASHWVVRGNVIKNTALYEGLCEKGTLTGYALYPRGGDMTIEYNQIDSTGYIPIRFTSNDDILIKNNYINAFNLIKNDGGGIYSWNGSDNTNRKVIGNIILNGNGGGEGLGMQKGASTSGIYFDNDVANVEVSGNTVANCSKTGIYIHNSYGIKIRNNTLFNNTRQIVMVHDNIAPRSPLRNLHVRQNIFFSKMPSQTVSTLQSSKNDLNSVGSLDSNYYCRPLEETFVNEASYVNSSGERLSYDYDLKGWQDATIYDDHSRKTCRQIPFYIVNSILSVNKCVNGKIDSDLNGIYTSGTSSWVSSKIDGGTLQASVSATNNVYQVIFKAGAVSTTKNYVIRFTAQSAKDTVISVYLRQSKSPYNKTSETRSFKVGPTKKDYEFIFRAPTTDLYTSVVFATKGKDFQFWLDNVQLHEADITVPDPSQFIRFEYNATGQPKTVALDAAYLDVKSRSYNSSVTLDPYSSIVLVKDLQTTTQEKANQAPTVSLVSPVANTTVNAPASLAVTATAQDADGSVAKVEFYIDTLLVGADTVAPYSINMENVKAGTYNLTAKATDNKGLTTTSAAVKVVVVAPVIPINDTLIAFGSGWKYLDKGTDEGIAWKESSFEDASWKSGNGVFGYGQGDEKTVLSFGPDNQNKYITTYFRKTVNIRDTSAFSGYLLKMRRDDGAVVYINGVEVYRTNMPTGPITYSTVSATLCSDDGKRIYSKSLALSALRQGINVIAVEVHQRRGTSGDVTFDMELKGVRKSSAILPAIAESPVASESVLALEEEEESVFESPVLKTEFSTKVYPNPSRDHFSLLLQSKYDQPLTVRIVNLAGRVIDSRTGVAANSTVQFGHNLASGIYVVQVLQGTRKAEVKITKL